jgi:hypothetical protein
MKAIDAVQCGNGPQKYLFPCCPRCQKPMRFRKTIWEDFKFPRTAECLNCKIAGVGKTDRGAWDMVIYFEADTEKRK